MIEMIEILEMKIDIQERIPINKNKIAIMKKNMIEMKKKIMKDLINKMKNHQINYQMKKMFKRK